MEREGWRKGEGNEGGREKEKKRKRRGKGL